MKKTSHLVGMILLLSGCLTVREDQVLKQINAAAAATPTPTPSPCNSSLSPFGGGTGGAADPYLVCTATHLSNVKDYLSSSFKLYANINLSGVSFSPIGTNDSTSALSGEFDGNNFAISNWSYSNDSDAYAVGFVRKLAAGGVIKNLTLSALNLNGNNIVAGFAGVSEGSISSVTLLNSTLVGKSMVAGIVGEATGSASLTTSSVISASLTSTANGSRIQDHTIKTAIGGVVGLWNSTANLSSVSVLNTDLDFSKNSSYHDFFSTAAGGVVGFVENAASLVTDAAFTGAGSILEGYFNVGGISGYTVGGISESVVNATVMGNTRVGGVAGFSSGTTTKSSFVGTVLGDDVDSGISNGFTEGEVGGLIGSHSGFLTESFFSGSVIGDVFVGGLVGTASSSNIRDCYARGTLSGSADPVAGAFSRVLGGVIERVYVYLTSLSSSTGTAQAMIGTVISEPTKSNLFYYENGTSPTNGGTPISTDIAMRDISNFSGYSASGKWRTPTAYSGRSGLSPVLAWECSLAGVTCAP